MAELHPVMRAGQAGKDLGRPRGCGRLRVVFEDHEKQQCTQQPGRRTGDVRRGGRGQVTEGPVRSLTVLRRGHQRMSVEE